MFRVEFEHRWAKCKKYPYGPHCKLSYDVASGSEITPCIKIEKPLFGKRFEMTLLMLRIKQNPKVFTPKICFSNNFNVI